MPITDRQITLRFLAAPTDVATLGGGVRGGRILEWVDKAAYACAAAWSGGYSVTAYVGNISFGRDISSGDIVEVTATLVHTGRSSMHIECTVGSADPREGTFHAASSCLLVFVAVDDDGRPTPVRQWQPVLGADVAKSREAQERAERRRRIEAAMELADYRASSAALDVGTRFLAAPTDVNWGGNAHGGRVMSWIDDAAYLCGVRWCSGASEATGNGSGASEATGDVSGASEATGNGSGEVATAYMGGVRFYRPIHIGQVAEVSARLIHTGEQTLHIAVDVRAYWPREGSETSRLAAHSLTVLAALDDAGDATRVRPWLPQLPGDVALDRHARELIAIRGRRAPARECRMVAI